MDDHDKEGLRIFGKSYPLNFPTSKQIPKIALGRHDFPINYNSTLYHDE